MRPLAALLSLLLAIGPSAAMAAAPVSPTPAHDPDVPDTVVSIQIEGAVNVKPADVSARLKTRIGAALTRDALREDLKSIWEMDRFEDVSIDVQTEPEGYRVTFLVREHPVIRKVKFIGIKALNDKELDEYFKVKEGKFFDPVEAREGKRILLEAYREKGYPRAKVRTELIMAEDERGKMDLIVTAEEGSKMHVRKITFEGNKSFPEGVLRKSLKNKEKTFFFSSGLFREGELEADKARIVNFYKNEGYQKAKVLKLDITVDPEKENYRHLEFTVQEGIQFSVREISFEGGGLAGEDEMRKKLGLKAGDKLSQRKLDEGMARIRDIYTTRGYIYASIEPVFTFYDEKADASLVLKVIEGGVARVDRILVRGNAETKDKVILREIVVKPGDIFDTDKIRRSQERVFNLGFFEDVRVYPEPSIETGKENLVFEVKERQTGTISLGGGYSSQYGLVGFLQLTKANLFGLGIRISAEWEFGKNRKNLQLDYFDPYFLDSDFSLGVGFWDTDRVLPNTFEEHSTGGSIEFGRRFWEYWRASLGYRYQLDDVDPIIDHTGDGVLNNDDLPSGVSGEKLATSSPSFSLSYDTRDNVFDPMRGWQHRIYTQVAGGPLPGVNIFGGDTRYYKAIYDGSVFMRSPGIPLIPEPTLAMHTRLGRVWGYGDDKDVFGEGVPIFERFFLGGTDSIRGYEERLLGPRDPVTGQPAGGLAMWQLNSELKWPVVRRVLTLAVPFFDMGNSWVSFPRLEDIDSAFNPLPMSYGFGIRLTVPGTIILIRIDYGWGITERLDKRYWPEIVRPTGGKFHFNIGNIF